MLNSIFEGCFKSFEFSYNSVFSFYFMFYCCCLLFVVDFYFIHSKCHTIFWRICNWKQFFFPLKRLVVAISLSGNFCLCLPFFFFNSNESIQVDNIFSFVCLFIHVVTIVCCDIGRSIVAILFFSVSFCYSFPSY